jgi:hypothetical protein
VFRHWGRTSGHGEDGAGGAGLEEDAGMTGEELGLGTLELLEVIGLAGVEDNETGAEGDELAEGEHSGPAPYPQLGTGNELLESTGDPGVEEGGGTGTEIVKDELADGSAHDGPPAYPQLGTGMELLELTGDPGVEEGEVGTETTGDELTIGELTGLPGVDEGIGAELEGEQSRPP